MKIRAALLALSLLLAFAAIAQEENANTQRGFAADKIYDFNEIDSVDLFNGGLKLNIPIGPRYQVNGELSYGLTLFYNNQIWDLRYGQNYVYWPPTGTYEWMWYTEPYLDYHANAGPGWLLSMGRVYDLAYFIYEAPDGSRHELGTETDALDDVGDVAYSRTSSHIRAKRVSSTVITCEFADGTTHTFEKQNNIAWRLKEIKDRFGNKITLGYGTDGYTISDDHGRVQSVYFVPNTSFNSYGNRRIDKVVLSGFGDGATQQYKFNYETSTHEISCEMDGPMMGPTTLTTSFLKSITLPDNSQYVMKYSNSNGTTQSYCDQALITSLKLPTRGTIKWSYIDYTVPTDACYGRAWGDFQVVPGVGTRSLLDENLADGGRVTTYTPGRSPAVGSSSCSSHAPSEYVWTTVKAPDGGRTINYFSNWHYPDPSPNGYKGFERGLPFRRLPDGRKLASEFLGTCTGTNCPALRSTYVRWEYERTTAFRDQRASFNRRKTYEKTVFHDDGNRFIERSSGNYDGVGHFRNTIIDSNIGGEVRFESIGWDGTTGEMTVNADGIIQNDVTRPGVNDPWVLNTYAYRSFTENGTTAKTSFCFDKTTGAMLRSRTQASEFTGSKDLLKVMSYSLPLPHDQAQNGKGNVLREEYYGGDEASLDTANLVCDMPLPSGGPRYTILHEYAYGKRKTSRYKDATYLDLDLTIDKNSGLPESSRDSSGIETLFAYDQFLRLKQQKPAHRVTTELVNNPLAIIPSASLKTYLPNTTTVVTDQRVYYDPFGRVMQVRQLMEGGWAVTNTTYDVMGRKKTTSEPQLREVDLYEGPTLFTPANVTTYAYDLYGNITSITRPDASQVTYLHTGKRQKTTTKYVATALGQPDTAVVSNEYYDHQGRLLKVVEKSGPTTATSPVGADVTTDYNYDVLGQLTGVKMTGSAGVVQNRIFDYDGRGFLRWESHPESGMTAYTYDANGHVRTKRQGAANTQFDLNYQYDFAERLIQVDSRNPQSPTQFQVFKEFEFGTANIPPSPPTDPLSDYRKGKLVRSTRHNYSNREWDPVYKIDNLYDYKDAAGRLHGKKTVVTKLDDYWPTILTEMTTSVELNELDQVSKVIYPMCVGCGAPPYAPTRAETVHHYQYGRLAWIDGIVGSATNRITYWPNGLRQQLPHANLINDRQEVGNMARPTEISFKQYDRCVRPTFLSQPSGAAGATTLTVSVAGTGPFQYEWWYYDVNGQGGSAGTTQSITVNPTVKTTYYVTVGNACGYESSQDAVVVPSGCENPTTGFVTPVLQPDGSWIIRPNPTARSPRTFTWRRVSDNAVVGTQETFAVGSLSATTTYSFTVTDACGSATTNVTIKVPLPITTTQLAATWIPATGIRVTWPASTGANEYVLERRAGPEWEWLAQTTSTTYDDTAIQTGRTYAYRVYATATNGSKSPYSNSDVASTLTYPVVSAGQPVAVQEFNNMLDAVNKVRGAAGLPVVTWGNILAPSDPLPNPGTLISARHIMACRARMTEALQSMGAIPKAYTDPDPVLRTVKAVHINELLDQVK